MKKQRTELQEKASSWAESYTAAVQSYDTAQDEAKALHAVLLETKENLNALAVTPRLKSTEQHKVKLCDVQLPNFDTLH